MTQQALNVVQRVCPTPIAPPNTTLACPFDQCPQHGEEFVDVPTLRTHVRHCGSNSFKCKAMRANGDLCGELFNPSYEFHSHFQCKTYTCIVCWNNRCDPTWAAIDKTYVDYQTHLNACDVVKRQCNLIIKILLKARAKADVDLYNNVSHAGPIYLIQLEVNAHYEQVTAAQAQHATRAAFQDLIQTFRQKLDDIHKMINVTHYMSPRMKSISIPLISVNTVVQDRSSMPANLDEIVADAVHSTDTKIVFSQWDVYCNEILSISADLIDKEYLKKNRYYESLALQGHRRVNIKKNIEDVLIKIIKQHPDMMNVTFETLQDLGFEITGPAI
jgi:hypothetical protein